MNPSVSVIVPNFQHAKFLDVRLQSILKQTYQDFELIILADCSQDDGASRAIIESYRSDPHVSHIVYNEVNSGSPFKQWRKGLELAKGDYVWIAESDDFCLPTLLETLHDACVKNDVILAFCNSIFTNENGTFLGSDNPFDKNVLLQGRDFIRKHLSDSPAIVNASAVLFKKAIALAINRQYENLKGSGDRFFWIELAEHGNIYYENEALNCFRRHDSSVTKHNYSSGNREIEHHIIYNYLVRNNLLSTSEAFQIRLKTVDRIEQSTYENSSVKSALLKLWDRYYVSRAILPFNKVLNRIHTK